ncbi:UNVERIFIED_ORG: hypothetical protein J2Y81_002089 [Paraburkholderia sediminicola]|nr:hypothetical protein [Paraburkholderia sediminicola]
MSLVPSVVGTVVATNAADVGISGRILIYVAAAALFGLIGLVPLLAGEPKPDAPPSQWTVVDSANQNSASIDTRLTSIGLTIDGDVKEVKEPLWLAGDDPRWGR